MIQHHFQVGERTLPEAYHHALRLLRAFGEVVDCPDWGCSVLELPITITVQEPLAEPMISRLIPCGPIELEQYRQEMLDGILDFEVERGNWPYTYHQRMADQIPFVLRELQRNPYSRRAVIDIRTPDDMDNPDPACLQHIQYVIRGGELDCFVLFRSNDACKATFMNAFALICLQDRIAHLLGVKCGSYVHRANSFHCYDRDFDLLDGYIRRILKAGDGYIRRETPVDMPEPITYRYRGEWDAEMQAARPEIAAKVEALRGRAGV